KRRSHGFACESRPAKPQRRIGGATAAAGSGPATGFRRCDRQARLGRVTGVWRCAGPPSGLAGSRVMQWKGRRGSRNIEDRRGQGGGGGLRSGGVAGAGGLGVVVVFVIAMLLGVDPRHLLE